MKKIFKYTFLILILVFACFAIKANKVSAQTFTFGSAGDFANGGNFQATVNQVKAQNVDFQVAVGDLAYTTAEQSWCNTWKNAGFNNILITSGNHDSGESSSGNINTYAQFCPYTLSSPLTGTYGKQYYFDYPQANPTTRFILISAGLGGSFIGFDTNYASGHQGYTFVSNAIDNARTQGIKWVIVGTHKNCLSMGTKSCEIGSDLMNLLINKRVDLVLQGHDHNYQRSKQLTCATTNNYNAACVANDGASGVYAKGAGTIFMITGTGGQGQYTINTSDSEAGYFAKWMGANLNSTSGFNKYTVTPTQITAQFIRSAGGTFSDSFLIVESGTSTPTPTATSTQAPTTPPTATPTPTPTATSAPTSTSLPTATGCPTIPAGSGVSSFTTIISTAGNYTFWGRMMGAGDSANSYYLQIDNNCPIVVGDVNGTASNTWIWQSYPNLNLTAGNHTVKIAGRESNVKVDEILFLDTTCVPTNFGDNCNLNGDANGDTRVDNLDYDIWFSHYGQTISGVSNGNFNGDSVVDGIDYVIWLVNFGK